MGYLHVHFRQLRMTFFHKIMVAEKNIFLPMHKTILQRVKKFEKSKNNNHSKN